MNNLAGFTAIVALGNLGVTIWHLRLASELNPALSSAEAVRIGALTVVLTLAGVICFGRRVRWPDRSCWWLCSRSGS